MKSINRRDFLETTAFGATAVAGATQAPRTQQPTGPQTSTQSRTPRDPNRRLSVGLIGCGWFGW